MFGSIDVDTTSGLYMPLPSSALLDQYEWCTEDYDGVIDMVDLSDSSSTNNTEVMTNLPEEKPITEQPSPFDGTKAFTMQNNAPTPPPHSVGFSRLLPYTRRGPIPVDVPTHCHASALNLSDPAAHSSQERPCLGACCRRRFVMEHIINNAIQHIVDGTKLPSPSLMKHRNRTNHTFTLPSPPQLPQPKHRYDVKPTSIPTNHVTPNKQKVLPKTSFIGKPSGWSSFHISYSTPRRISINRRYKSQNTSVWQIVCPKPASPGRFVPLAQCLVPHPTVSAKIQANDDFF